MISIINRRNGKTLKNTNLLIDVNKNMKAAHTNNIQWNYFFVL